MAGKSVIPPILALPVEVRLQIIEHLLPYRDSITYHASRDWYSPSGQIDNWEEKSYLSPSGEEPTVGILTVNQQIHAEACEILGRQQRLPYEIIIDERSFYKLNPEQMMVEVDNNVIPEWKDLFPSANLSKAKELCITVIPQDFPGFWPCLSAALKVLCQDVLSQRTLPPKLVIDLHDMRPCFDLDNTPQGLFHDAEMVKACFRDYKAALVPFLPLASKIESCEVHLPYWMEFTEGMAEFRQDLRDQLKAQTVFTPLDLSCFKKELVFGLDYEDKPWELEDGAPVRWVGWRLAELADDELERSKRGLKQRFAATGSWE